MVASADKPALTARWPLVCGVLLCWLSRSLPALADASRAAGDGCGAPDLGGPHNALPRLHHEEDWLRSTQESEKQELGCLSRVCDGWGTREGTQGRHHDPSRSHASGRHHDPSRSHASATCTLRAGQPETGSWSFWC
eukprot:2909063-Rhodomonas_salina.1